MGQFWKLSPKGEGGIYYVFDALAKIDMCYLIMPYVFIMTHYFDRAGGQKSIYNCLIKLYINPWRKGIRFESL